jgi:hypothetical protein
MPCSNGDNVLAESSAGVEITRGSTSGSAVVIVATLDVAGATPPDVAGAAPSAGADVTGAAPSAGADVTGAALSAGTVEYQEGK